jgi:hypothetical protein
MKTVAIAHVVMELHHLFVVLHAFSVSQRGRHGYKDVKQDRLHCPSPFP